MNLKKTLSKLIIILFLNNIFIFYVYADDHVAACNMALEKGDASLAVKEADIALGVSTKQPSAFLCKGRALGVLGKYTDAMQAFDSAEKQASSSFDSIVANILAGNLLQQQQKYQDAIVRYKKSLTICTAEKNDKYARINLNLIGESYFKNNALSDALANYQAGSKLAMNDNERADSFARLATVYKAFGQYDSAVEYQVKCVRMQQEAGTLDQYADASLELGQIYITAKDYTGADRVLGKFLQFAKDNGGVYYEAKADLYLAQSKLASGDVDRAKALLKDARSVASNLGDSALNREIELASQQFGQ